VQRKGGNEREAKDLKVSKLPGPGPKQQIGRNRLSRYAEYDRTFEEIPARINVQKPYSMVLAKPIYMGSF
jgi:hypothetical protein